MPYSFRHFTRVLGASIMLAQAAALGQADKAVPADPAVRDLAEQNQLLQKRVEAQQRQIDELRDRLDRLQKEGATAATTRMPEPESSSRELSGLAEAGRQVRISGETGLAFFSGGQNSAYPNSEFSVDEARIFVEAPVWHNVYFFGGLELATRENTDGNIHLGEIYVDMEDVLTAGRSRNLSLRIGRFNIPFGEEYQYRNVMTNPLITHSVADLWGYDTGVEAYGTLGSFQYILAVQNGGLDRNKALTARVSFEPVKSLHLSASAHHTGKLDAANDFVSPIWFGGAFFRAMPPGADTHSFDVGLFELDATWTWKEGHLRATAGTAQYHDDDPSMDNSRRLRYVSVEGMQQIAGPLYGAARYSEVRAPGGYPIMGQADGGEYFYSPYSPLTTDLQRLSVGLGYRFGPPFVWKVEYSWERGHLVGGYTRNDEDLLSTEIGIQF